MKPYHKKSRSQEAQDLEYAISRHILQIQILLEELDKKLTFTERSMVLDLEPQEIFAVYTPFQMEERAVPVVSLFSRSSILLSVFRCELRNLLDEYIGQNKPGLTEGHISRIGDLLVYISELREKHINNYGRRVYEAFNCRLLSPEEHAEVELNDLQLLLVRFFGSTSLGGTDGLTLSRLGHVILAFGRKAGCLRQAMNLTEAVFRNAGQSDENHSEPIDAGTWSARMNSLTLDLQVKMAHLQKDLEETICELNLDGTNQKALFQDISLYKVREMVSYLHQKFIRADLLLRCYAAELRFALMECDQTQLSEPMLKTIGIVSESINVLQRAYVQKYTARITCDLKRRLGVYKELDDLAEFLDKYLVGAFDLGMMQAYDAGCPGLQELQELLVLLGKLLGMEEDAEVLLNGIRSLELCQEPD